ncbi:MAG TPA: hypothetical protein VGH28_15750 [Polyangiaceae bacterium]|jgi:hypothetical protein
MTSTRCSILVSTIAVSIAASAAAQSSAAIAEGLFRDGKKLLEQKKYADACPKFEESARLDPSSGVELALGICYEGLGKTASAWGAYESAISLARRDNRKDRERAATVHASALEHKLSHVTIDVPAEVAKLDGLVIKEDGVAIGAAAWADAPVDPGSHTLDVAASGKKPWSTTFTVDRPSSTQTVTVPALENDERVVIGPSGETSRVLVRVPTHPLRTISIVTLGAGAASLVAASVLGGIAIGDASDAHKACPGSPCSNATAVSENDTAGTLADWSTALFVVSGVLVATSVVLFLIRGPDATRAASIHPIVAPGFAGLGGTF